MDIEVNVNVNEKSKKLRKVKYWDYYKKDAKKGYLVADLGKKYICRYVVLEDKYKDSNVVKRVQHICFI